MLPLTLVGTHNIPPILIFIVSVGFYSKPLPRLTGVIWKNEISPLLCDNKIKLIHMVIKWPIPKVVGEE